MKALVKAKADVGLWLEDRPVPEIGPDDVLIRVRKTGICGTDIHIWNWDDWAAKTVPVPLVTGHEFAGEIVELGRNVTDLKIGQRCSGEGHLIGHQSRQSRSSRQTPPPGPRLAIRKFRSGSMATPLGRKPGGAPTMSRLRAPISAMPE